MPTAAARDLYLQIGATIDPLKAALLAGRSLINEFGVSGAQSLLDLDKSFTKLADTGIGGAKQLEKSYNDSFRRIQAAARAALAAPDIKTSFAIVNAQEAQQAAENAHRVATELREVADAAERARQAQDGDNRALTAYATAAQAAALGAERQAAGLREQAVMLESVRAQLKQTELVQEEMTGTVLEGHRRMGASSLIFEHVIRASGDSFAAGMPPAQIFAEQLGRVAEAAQFLALETNATTGVMGRFASFMGGPWGLAVTVAVAALVPLLRNLKLFDDEVDEAVRKLKDDAHQTDISRQAADAFANTMDGQTEAIRKNTKALEDNIYTQEQQHRRALDRAKATLDGGYVRDDGTHQDGLMQMQKAARDELNARLARLRQAQVNAQALAGTEAGDAASRDLVSAESAVEEQRRAIRNGLANISEQKRAIRSLQSEVGDDRVEALTDPRSRIKFKYDDLETKLKERATDGDISPAEYERQRLAYERARQAALDAEKAREHPARGLSASAENQLGQMTALIDKLFPNATITSTTNHSLYTASGKISDHSQSRALDFVVPNMQNWTRDQAEAFKAHVRETLTEAGVKIRRNANGVEQLFVTTPSHPDERGVRPHIHVAWERAGSVDALGRRVQAQENSFARDQNTLAADVETAERDRDRALLALKPAADQELALNLAIIASDAQKLKSKAAELVTLAKVSDAQRKTLQGELQRYDAAIDAATAAKQEVARRNEHEKQVAKALETAKAQFSADAEYLRLQIALADTAKERRALQKKLLDNEIAAAQAGPLSVLGDKDATPDAKAAARAQLQQIDRTTPLKQQQLNDATLDPVQKLIDDWKKASGDINTSLKSIEADGLKSVSDHLANVLDGTESAKKAFKALADSAIADLTRLAVKFALSKLFPSSGGGGGGGGGAGGDLGAIASIATLFAANGHVPGFAAGGFVDPRGIIHGPGTPTSDSILARVSRHEAIINARAVRRYGPLLQAMNQGTLPAFADGGFANGLSYPALPTATILSGNRSAATQAVFDLRGALTTEQLLADVNQRVQNGTAVAISGGAALAQSNIDQRQYQRIPE